MLHNGKLNDSRSSKLSKSYRLSLYRIGVAGNYHKRCIGESAHGKAALALNVFVSIEQDDSVNIVAHRSEMGRRIRTSLPQIVADEMEADWRKVNIVQAIADEKYGNQDTDGSRSVRTFFQTMREIGAAAKLMLRQAAAQTLLSKT